MMGKTPMAITQKIHRFKMRHRTRLPLIRLTSISLTKFAIEWCYSTREAFTAAFKFAQSFISSTLYVRVNTQKKFDNWSERRYIAHVKLIINYTMCEMVRRLLIFITI